jgi:hypothetical protein
MHSWVPVAILPNLSGGRAIDAEMVAFAPFDDARVAAMREAIPLFSDLLSRFSDAFGVPLKPFVFILRKDAELNLSAEAPLSFRDLVTISVIPHSRSLNTVYKTTNRVVYVDSFGIYPWMLSKDNDALIASTPAFRGFEDVKKFRGQSSPELPVMRIEDRDIDATILDALILCWERHYFRRKTRWKDRALFRSLNMAAQPASMPAKIERLKAARYPLPCWVYGKLYQARNHFLHGNPIPKNALSPKGTKNGLFWLAPSLYRFALTGFLSLSIDPSVRKKLPYRLSDAARANT